MSDKKERRETSVRMDADLHRRLRTIAQVEGVSLNQIIVSSVAEAVMFYEGDPEFRARHKKWLDEQASL